MSDVVFLGPSLPRDIATTLLPEAIFLPPARQADIVSAIHQYRPTAIGLIDGEFGQSLSVWHKELLYALDRGIRVLGAASMGALRAAELDSLGMIGVGEVYRQFASRELEDDDEVAVVHTTGEHGFVPLSQPMVNIRATLMEARNRRLITTVQCDSLVRIAKSLYFANRSFDRLFLLAAELLSDAQLEQLRAYAASDYQDVKASDARLLLEKLQGAPPEPATTSTPGARGSFVPSKSFGHLYENERRVRRDNTEVPLRTIASHAALTRTDFNAMNFAALNLAVVQELAAILGVRVSTSEVEAEERRFWREREVRHPADADRWLEDNDLNQQDFQMLLRELATARRLQRWLFTSQRGRQQTRYFLNELRTRGVYPSVADEAAAEYAREGGRGDVISQARGDVVQLVDSHMQTAGSRPGAALEEWLVEAGFDGAQDLAYHLSVAAAGRTRSPGVRDTNKH